MSNASVPELAQYGLAMSFDFATHRTTAFIKDANAVVKDSASEYQPWLLDARIRNGLHDSMPLWAHPPLLPVILLQHELAAIREFSKKKLHTNKEHETLWKTLKKRMRRDRGSRVANSAGRAEQVDMAHDAEDMNSKGSFDYHLNRLVRRRPRQSGEEHVMESGGSHPRQE